MIITFEPSIIRISIRYYCRETFFLQNTKFPYDSGKKLIFNFSARRSFKLYTANFVQKRRKKGSKNQFPYLAESSMM